MVEGHVPLQSNYRVNEGPAVPHAVILANIDTVRGTGLSARTGTSGTLTPGAAVIVIGGDGKECREMRLQSWAAVALVGDLS
jgi:hypothetical protein